MASASHVDAEFASRREAVASHGRAQVLVPADGTSRVVSRWIVLVASLAAEICGGAMYAFGVYSEQLRITLSYSQTQLQSLALASNIGNFCNIPSGIVQDRCGTRVTVLCGIAVNFAGYFLLWLVATERLELQYPYVFGISMLWGNGSGWFDTAVITTNMANFPSERGVVVGLLKSFFGLSSALLSLVFFAFFNPLGAPASADTFILFLAVALSAVGLAIVPAVNTVPQDPPPPERTTAKTVRCRLLLAYGNVLLLAVVLGFISLAAAGLLPGGSDLLPELPPTRYRYLTGIVGGLLALFCFIPCGAGPMLYRGPAGHRAGSGCGSCCCCCRRGGGADRNKTGDAAVRADAGRNRRDSIQSDASKCVTSNLNLHLKEISLSLSPEKRARYLHTLSQAQPCVGCSMAYQLNEFESLCRFGSW
jgi:MFS family permease